jgi:hypothetical protein
MSHPGKRENPKRHDDYLRGFKNCPTDSPRSPPGNHQAEPCLLSQSISQAVAIAVSGTQPTTGEALELEMSVALLYLGAVTVGMWRLTIFWSRRKLQRKSNGLSSKSHSLIHIGCRTTYQGLLS